MCQSTTTKEENWEGKSTACPPRTRDSQTPDQRWLFRRSSADNNLVWNNCTYPYGAQLSEMRSKRSSIFS